MAPQIFVLLHSGGASSRQWNPLAARLAARGAIAVLPSLVGHDRVPGWNGLAPSLEGELDRLCEQIPAASAIHLVGHSYGAAVAVKAALSGRLPVKSLAVYEPMFFSMLAETQRLYDSATSPRQVGETMLSLMRQGHHEPAARMYIDYWHSGPTFDALPAEHRAKVIERMPVVMDIFAAMVADTASLGELRHLAMPCLVMSGNRSPQPAQDLSAMLAAGIANARHHRFAQLHHMGPITAPAVVNAVIEEFLVDIGALEAPPSATRPPFPALRRFPLDGTGAAA